MSRLALALALVALVPALGRASELRCDACDDGVVLLRRGTASCLGALVGPAEVITAGHCVHRRPDEPWSVVFPATATRPMETVEARVLDAEFDLAAGKDFARLRLATPTDRVPYRVSTEALADGEVVRHWRRRQVPGGEELFAEPCEVVHASFALPTADSVDARRLVLGGCDVRFGDSGGPVVADGALVALNQAWIYDLRSDVSWLPVDARWRARPPVITVVNLRCAMGGLCRWPPPWQAREAWEREARRRLHEVEERVLDELSSFVRAHPELYLRPVRKRRGALEVFRIAPVCVEGAARVVALPRVEVRRALDAFGRFVVQTRSLPAVSRRLRPC